METENAEDDFIILDSLDIELIPRMNEEEIAASSEKRLLCLQGKNKAKTREWFIYLNVLAHSKKLIMKDSDQMAGVIRG